jgi:hypothetical protein
MAKVFALEQREIKARRAAAAAAFRRFRTLILVFPL